MQTREPYIGPRAFDESDRDLFFGRDQEANELVSLITAHAAVLLYAPSGAGKTSLVKAGVIPLLVDEEKFTVLPPMRVRENVSVAAQPEGVDNVYIFNALSSIPEQKGLTGLARLSLSDYLTRYREVVCKAKTNTVTTIVFDQFEELFTFYPERWEDRKGFFLQIRDALARDPLLRVLFSMREDFVAELDPYACLMPEKMRTRLRVEHLREKTAVEAVKQPLQKVETANSKREFAPGVAEELVNNLLQVKVKTPAGVRKVKGEFVEALQLQVVCRALWQNLSDDDQLITRSHLETFGDVDKALEQFYENALKKTNEKTDIKLGKLRQWFERALITPTGTRGTVFRGESETGGIPNEVVDELENQRIIRMELRGGAQWYELTHDRFVETVLSSNQKWLLTRPATEQIHKRLEEKAADWEHNDRQDKYLLDDVELSLAQRWMAITEIEPSRELTALVRASKQLSDKKRKDSIERRRRLNQQARTARVFRRLTLTLSIVTVLGFVALFVAGLLWRSARNAAQAARKAEGEAVEKKKELEGVVNRLEAANKELMLKDRIIKESSAEDEAVALMNAGKLDEAENRFQSLLKTYEEKSDLEATARTYLSLGDISLKRGQHASAIGRYDKALAMLGKDEKYRNFQGQAYMRKGALYFDWGKRKEEQADYKTALAKYNNSFGFYQKAINIFRQTKNSAGAHDARNGFDEAKRRYDEMKEKLEAQTSLKQDVLR